MLVILREKTKNSRTRSYPTLVIQVSLQVIDLDLKLRFGFGEAGIGSVQFLHLVLKIEILLSQSSLEAIEIVVLAGQIVDLDSQSGNGSLQRVDLGISGGLYKRKRKILKLLTKTLFILPRIIKILIIFNRTTLPIPLQTFDLLRLSLSV